MQQTTHTELKPLFQMSTRTNGEAFYTFSGAMTEEIKTKFYESDFHINDTYYKEVAHFEHFVRDCLSNNSTWDDILEDYINNIEGDIYNNALAHWLVSDPEASSYCDDVLNEGLTKEGIYSILQLAQARQKADIVHKFNHILKEYYGVD